METYEITHVVLMFPQECLVGLHIVFLKFSDGLINEFDTPLADIYISFRECIINDSIKMRK